MTKIRKNLGTFILTILCLLMVFSFQNFSVVNAASGLEDENQTKLDQATGVDTDGDVYNVEDDDSGKVESNGISTFSAKSTSVKIVNFRTKGNAVTNYTEVGTGVSGYTNGAYGADAAYLGTSNGKVKFMLSGVVGWVDEDDVQVINFSSAKSSSCYKVSGGRLIHYITCDMTTPGHATSLDNGAAPSYLKSGTTYYSYDGHYFYTSYSTMLTDYTKGVRTNSVNKSNPYYNYFQYLPLRSETSYSSSSLNSLLNAKISDYTSSSSKMKSTASTFLKYQNTYGVNALLAIGVAGNESAWGTSSICKNKNNLFGLNAVDSSPGTSASTYASIDECIKQFTESYMSKGYLNPNDWRMKGGFLGNKGSGINVSYASDPYWGEKAANMAYTLDKNGGRKDEGKYTIGIKDTINTNHNSVNVRNSASTSGKVLYNTDTYSNYAVLILNSKATNSFYKIQSEPALNSGRTAISSNGKYDFDSMYAYISSDYVTIVNKGSDVAVSKSLSSISISTAPKKTTYTAGETFDSTGMVVKAKFSDGTTSDVTKSVKYSTSSLKTGTTSVTISYTYNGVTKNVTQKITVKDPVTVSKVAINPTTIDLEQGSSKTFGVSVTGTGSPAQTVKWSISGQKSSDTKISSTGLLKIASDETAKTITVKAVSTVDTTKNATATVNVVVKEDNDNTDVTNPDKDDNTSQGGNDSGSSVTDPDNGDQSGDGGDVTKPEEGDNQGNTDGSSNNGNEDNKVEVIEQQLEDKNTGIFVNGVLPTDTKLLVEEINEQDSHYDQLTAGVENNTILGVYDISLSNELEEGQSVSLGFNVDEKYNNEEVVVLHFAEVDGVVFTETFKAKVEDGQVKIDVDGFSPYVIALNDANNNNNSTSTTDDPKDDANNTNDNDNKGDNAITNNNDNNGSSGDKSNVEVGKSEDSAIASQSQSSDNNAQSRSVETVNTADENNIALWTSLFVLSAIASLTISFVLIKKNKLN
ncbi:glucosaminidase domain-containing protein [Anaerofustis stercorihominis]|uniref:glucosaminidase domain-containing protein n=1 Tax=Anaerofustis stercorihominis TaxID=214853 RepID=UPI001105CAF9|nr:glucosaminidase domain-containing protein [Anaerofustis stercorihominis]